MTNPDTGKPDRSNTDTSIPELTDSDAAYRDIAHLAAAVRTLTDPEDPLVRAVLDHAVRAWTAASDPVPALGWGRFAIAVQSVTAAIYHGPADLMIVAEPITDPDELADLVLAAADVFAAAAQPGHPRAWQYATAVVQLHAAVADLPREA
jgi:hypothetical protein